MSTEEEIDEKIKPNKEIEDAIKKSIKELSNLKGAEFKEANKHLEGLLHLQYYYETMQTRIYLLRKAQIRMKQIIGKAIRTEKFILGVAVVTIVFAGLLFFLMLWEATIAISTQDPEERTSATVLSAFFGGTGVADIFVLMKYVMNRAQRALADMVQIIIAYLSFKYQADSLLEWIQQNQIHENTKPASLDELIKINESIREAADKAMAGIQRYVENIDIPKTVDGHKDDVKGRDTKKRNK